MAPVKMVSSKQICLNQYLDSVNWMNPFWAEVIVTRACDHLPFHRQVQILTRDGISITRQCLSKTYINTGKALMDLGKLLKESIITFLAIHIDETTIKM